MSISSTPPKGTFTPTASSIETAVSDVGGPVESPSVGSNRQPAPQVFEPTKGALASIDAGQASGTKGGAAPGATVAHARLTVPGEALTRAIEKGAQRITAEATKVADQLLALPRQRGLIPMNIGAEGGVSVVRDQTNSALDAARTTRGLAELALTIANEHPGQASAYAAAAAENWQAARAQLRTENGTPIHLQTFGEGTRIGENTTDLRVNADGLYPASDSAAMVMLAEALGPTASLHAETYRRALIDETATFIRNFYQPDTGTFTYHADALSGSQAERETKGDVTHEYPRGVIGNDGTVYGLAALLVPTLRALGNDANTIEVPERAGNFTKLVHDQLDLISDTFVFKNGTMWETYAVTDDGALEPIRFAWQDQEVKPPVELPDGSVLTRSHVAIGGHTVMAASQLAEGALELYRLGELTKAECDRYLDRAVEIIQGAIDHGIINIDTGVVHNANLLEVPVEFQEQRTKPGGNDWGEAGWQQRELMQALLVLRSAGRLDDLKMWPQIDSPNGRVGELLLERSIRAVTEDFKAPEPLTSGFGGEWVYHVPRAAAYINRLR